MNAPSHIGLNPEQWLSERCGGTAFLTPSCTSALELACAILDIGPGQNVIMPSYGFPSCANAVIRRGAMPVFVDVSLVDLNIAREQVYNALDADTAAVMPIHYAGVQADNFNHLCPVIEDAAQAIGHWRLTGDIGCISFHRTKNIECGEGGAIILKPEYVEHAQSLRHCGTTYAQFDAGLSDKWEWKEVGTHALMSQHCKDILAQKFKHADFTTQRRRAIWSIYHENLDCKAPYAMLVGNGHFFWFLHPERERIIAALRKAGFKATRHFDALHTTAPAKRYCHWHPCPNSERAAAEIVRLDTSVGEETALRTCEFLNKIL